jgi:methionyl-tRNA formyltransferase
MRIVFAGTPEFSVRALDAIRKAGHQVVAVLTRPDRRSGRGLRFLPGPVKTYAMQAGLPVAQPASLRDAEAQRELAIWLATGNAELMIVAAYGLLLPPAVLAMPQLGCLNIHASLLPRWRGAAPVARAILAGDSETGVCIMQMDAGLDTGPVLLAKRTAIDARETAGSLTAGLARLGAEAMVEVLDLLERKRPPNALPQAEDGVTYAHKIDKAEAGLDFALSAAALDRKIRAFDPAPGATAQLRDAVLKIWRGRPDPASARALPPGTVRGVDGKSIAIACGPDGSDTLIVEELQKPGGKRIAVAQFLQGFALAAGERFGRSGDIG